MQPQSTSPNVRPTPLFHDPADRLRAAHIGYTRFLRALNDVFPEISESRDGLKATAYLPSLVAEIFDCRDAELISIVTEAHLCMDHFTHAVDDLTDNKTFNVNAFHAGQLMLGRSLSLYLSIACGSQTFMPYWARYLAEASEAERFLLRHRDVLPYDNTDFAMMGRKSALLKTSAAAFGCRAHQHQTLRDVESVLETISIAVQLMDDLRDCQEDVESGFYTFPVVSSHSVGHFPLWRNSLAVRSVLRTLSLAKEYLDRALEECLQLKAMTMARFVRDLRTSIEILELDVSGMVEAGDDQITFDKLRQKLTKRIQPRMDH